ncbi:MAG: aldehyde dehydrogenase [Planctomycetota bacterium]|nr:MAG: aldehyde dehydrogenase [Planctomycetota bacterium]
MITRSHNPTIGRNHGEQTRWLDRSVGSRADQSIVAPPHDELHVALSDLYAHQTRWLFESPRDRIDLVERCIETVAESARNWVDVACEIKHIPADSQCRAEEVLSGPVVAMRYLRLMLRNLKALDNGTPSPLPGRLTQADDGRWRVPVLPVTRDLFDPVCFMNFQAHVWLKGGICEDEANAATEPIPQRMPTTSLVLGAGNVTGIFAADVLGKIFQEQHVALVKLHPLTDPLRPVIEHAFKPLIDAGCLRIVSGDATVGARATQHDMVDAVHITGSAAAHDAIVWGADAAERQRRQRDDEPFLGKPISSELGNVSPWIIVPGRYSSMQLHAQAENVAASITNNAGFNCVSTRVLITWKQGALDRFERFTGCRFNGDELSEGTLAAVRSDLPQLPWTLFRDVNPAESPLLCREESFVPVCAEMPLEADDEFDFVGRATDFANEELWGTLCATLTVPSTFRGSRRGQSEINAAISRLRYGTVCLNQWPGLAFALLTLPWGGHPSGTVSDPQSGLGFVHNTFGLRAVEKTVLEGPLVVVPKPIWTPGHQSAEPIAWNLFNLYHQPTLRHVAELSYSAFVSLFK